MRTALHSGDLGDLIAALPVIRQAGGAKLFLCTRPDTKGFSDDRFNAIKPLLEIQPYIHGVERYDEASPIDLDFTDFRSKWASHPTLIGKQAVHVGMDPSSVDISPWLTIPDAHRHGKMVLCRSQRCLGSLHWFRFFHRPKDCLFIGLEEDYEQFCRENSPWLPHKKNMPAIEFWPTENLLEAAKLIKGSRLFISNQTSLLWVAFGLGFSPMIIEKVNDDSYLPMEGRRFVASAGQNPTAREFLKL